MVGTLADIDSTPGLDYRINCIMDGTNTHPDGTIDSLYTVDLYEDYFELSHVFLKLSNALATSTLGKYLERQFVNSQTDLAKIYKFFVERCESGLNTRIEGVQLLQNICGNFANALNILGQDIRQNYTCSNEPAEEFTVCTLVYLGFLSASEMFLRWFASILKLCLCETNGITTTPYVAEYVVSLTPFLAQFIDYTEFARRPDPEMLGGVVGSIRSVADGDNEINTKCIIDDSPFTHFADINKFPTTIQGSLKSFNITKGNFTPKNLFTKDLDARDRVEDTKGWLNAQIAIIQSEMAKTPVDSPEYKEQQQILSHYENRLANSTKKADEDVALL